MVPQNGANVRSRTLPAAIQRSISTRQASPTAAAGAWGGRTIYASEAASALSIEESCIASGVATSRPSRSAVAART